MTLAMEFFAAGGDPANMAHAQKLSDLRDPLCSDVLTTAAKWLQPAKQAEIKRDCASSLIAIDNSSGRRRKWGVNN